MKRPRRRHLDQLTIFDYCLWAWTSDWRRTKSLKLAQQ